MSCSTGEVIAKVTPGGTSVITVQSFVRIVIDQLPMSLVSWSVVNCNFHDIGPIDAHRLHH